MYADLGLGPAPSLAELVDARGRILLARLGGRPIGCGALRTLGPRTAEIKRMFVVADLRGRGIGRELLVALEGAARELDYERVRLDTGSRQQAAIGLYRSSGYQEIRDYNAKPGADLWFEKRL
ncbi:MAG: hypothetical protein QOI10_2262 [Solirubrobacterales bacterium]|nr:hypothetical protein [Solirubrobacterales bacterium]